MYEFEYHTATSLEDAAGKLADEEAKLVAGGMTLIADPETASREAVAADRSGQDSIAERDHRGRQHGGDRRDDPARRCQPLADRAARDPRSGRTGRHDRRPRGAQPRHDRRLDLEQRPRRRLSRQRSLRSMPRYAPPSAKSPATISSPASLKPRSNPARSSPRSNSPKSTPAIIRNSATRRRATRSSACMSRGPARRSASR